MAYYLTVEEQRGKYTELPITKSCLFPEKQKYDKKNACTLEEIDEVTTNFNNEFDFRLYLLREGILPLELADKNLSVRFL